MFTSINLSLNAYDFDELLIVKIMQAKRNIMNFL